MILTFSDLFPQDSHALTVVAVILVHEQHAFVVVTNQVEGIECVFELGIMPYLVARECAVFLLVFVAEAAFVLESSHALTEGVVILLALELLAFAAVLDQVEVIVSVCQMCMIPYLLVGKLALFILVLETEAVSILEVMTDLPAFEYIVMINIAESYAVYLVAYVGKVVICVGKLLLLPESDFTGVLSGESLNLLGNFEGTVAVDIVGVDPQVKVPQTCEE